MWGRLIDLFSYCWLAFLCQFLWLIFLRFCWLLVNLSLDWRHQHYILFKRLGWIKSLKRSLRHQMLWKFDKLMIWQILMRWLNSYRSSVGHQSRWRHTSSASTFLKIYVEAVNWPNLIETVSRGLVLTCSLKFIKISCRLVIKFFILRH